MAHDYNPENILRGVAEVALHRGLKVSVVHSDMVTPWLDRSEDIADAIYRASPLQTLRVGKEGGDIVASFSFRADEEGDTLIAFEGGAEADAILENAKTLSWVEY